MVWIQWHTTKHRCSDIDSIEVWFWCWFEYTHQYIHAHQCRIMPWWLPLFDLRTYFHMIFIVFMMNLNQILFQVQMISTIFRIRLAVFFFVHGCLQPGIPRFHEYVMSFRFLFWRNQHLATLLELEAENISRWTNRSSFGNAPKPVFLRPVLLRPVFLVIP